MVKTAASHFLACHSVISSRAPLSRNRRNRPVVCFAGDVIASSGRFPGVRARKWCVFALKWPFPWGPCTKRACFCAQVTVLPGFPLAKQTKPPRGVFREDCRGSAGIAGAPPIRAAASLRAQKQPKMPPKPGRGHSLGCSLGVVGGHFLAGALD